ncbi:carbohydrate-binding family 9-like protein [Chryseolinea lacunae]|uniref:Carbohydrate-binding family 9-like protein n=1 Tax=Chryseolinea lacunae TaxID=2801331 RepID=A0ABS1KNU1_9BACT|nr:carbohydrate-binding family 9-like protein [Chryseolinea lacunae]MBL0741120.1 carbohydrate-binding family 9-like protein [Chryseolinea lacunae]
MTFKRWLLLIGCIPMLTSETIPDTRGFQSDPQQRCPIDAIPHYQAARITQAPAIDGKLDDAVWQTARRSTPFRDLINGTATHRDTRAAVVWDDEYLYVAYWIEEPQVTATLTERDAPIYQDNDVELFIAGRDGYYELEINAHATIYEVLFFWENAFKQYGYNTLKEFDPTHPLARKFNGVGYRSHPRGKRIGFWNWDYPGLKKAVHVDGTLNNNTDHDKGWTVELALPWSGLSSLAKIDGRALPPKPGDVWRMDFSRFNTYKDAPPSKDSGGWAWSPHGVWDSHVPECFTFVEFVKTP